MIDKYLDLDKELKMNMRLKIILIIVGTLTTVLKWVGKETREIKNRRTSQNYRDDQTVIVNKNKNKKQTKENLPNSGLSRLSKR